MRSAASSRLFWNHRDLLNELDGAWFFNGDNIAWYLMKRCMVSRTDGETGSNSDLKDGISLTVDLDRNRKPASTCRHN